MNYNPGDQPVTPNWSLDGAHVLLTGVTGFLGQASLERLLADHPNTRVTVLVRGRGATSGADRVAGLTRKPVFRTLRRRIGGPALAELLAERVTVIEGDLTDAVPALPEDLTTVIHCASTVSFDPPIDDAFQVNVGGLVNLYDAIVALPRRPHVLHVSTAYVAGARKGVVAEAPLDHDVDWDAELTAALAARAEVERASRRPEALRTLLAEARAEHGKAGPQATARAAEEARRRRVTERLVDYGRLRAHSVGWPDVYTFTKALGERVAEQYARDEGLRVSVVRPAIVQSALRHPFPGWFDSFKMVDPIILSYGRGTLPDFPGLPDAVVDIVPIDLVTNALLAVAAVEPEPGTPVYYHVGTGARNPLTQRQLDENIRNYFRRHPLPEAGRGHIAVPTWRFPGASQIERRLRAGERAVSFAERALLRLPASPRTRDWMTKVHKETKRIESLRRLSTLYGVYTEVEAIYTDGNVLALHRRLPDEVVSRGSFDAAEVDWPHYLQEVHCPSITALLRQSVTRRPRSNRRAALPEGRDTVAVFDLEGTVVASNLIEAFLWARLADRPKGTWARELAALAGAAPRYLRAEQRSRGEFIRTFMRRYAGASEDALRELIRDRLGDALLRRSLPEAIRQVRAHRAAGHRTILITGTADILIESLRPLFDDVVASRLHVRDGVLTGFLAAPPLVGEARLAWLRQHAEDIGADLSSSYAYGDSFSDRSLLEGVGNPVAVNPDPKLFRHAKRHNWRIEEWGGHTYGPVETMVELTTSAAGPGARGAAR
ncbi:HAD-IB family hydrolase [Micromonospora ureilytica]|uniref:HAD-IB family hydrolase n=1 Tax=Micromonospora ureilytica TaxID=709868 RepID=UPI00403A32DD